MIRKDELVLLDLWGKLDAAGLGLRRHHVDRIHRRRPCPIGWPRRLRAICGARDAAVDVVQDAARAGREVRGFEADKAARKVLIDAGYEDAILHRTGHSLGENVHGNGAHLDDYETHDERRLLPGSGFTIEPGLYFKDFGVRTEINMVWTANGPEVTGPRQKAILSLL